MQRRRNPPRGKRRRLNQDELFWAEVESTVATSSTANDDNTITEASRSLEPEPDSDPEPERSFKYIVALDFGTTNTSVSYTKFDIEKGPGSLESSHIRSIRAWPDAGQASMPNVPSESWYLDGEYLWGHSVQQRVQEQLPEDYKPFQDVIKFSKMLLNDKREQPPELLEQLKRINKSVHDVITDYLIQIFTHVKQYLKKQEKLTDNCAVELVLCLPAGWDFAAQRDIQKIMENVSQAVDFGWRDFEPFIINEPEAVAAFLLESTDPREVLLSNMEVDVRPKKGQMFIVCDAGGGTVDATTYRVIRVNPYRFEEVIDPAGRDCGSSRINEKMIREAAERLEDNAYLKISGFSKEYLIQYFIVHNFEARIKKKFSYKQYSGEEESRIHIPIPGLRRDDEKDIGQNSFYITSNKMALYFKESIEGTVELLKQQKNAAESQEEDHVSNIILAGGFSASNALQERVEKEFAGVNILTLKNSDVSPIVSHGAVFRALNKENGPERRIMASFGLLQDEIFNKKEKGHTLLNQCTQGKLDAQRYAAHVIHWLIKKDKRVGKRVSFKSILSQHFDFGEDWIFSQKIYSLMSKKPPKDHYHVEHENNKMAEIAGIVEANLNEYRDSDLIRPKRAVNGREFFSLDYEIALEVDGRNIKAKLFYPPGKECRDELKICISAYFRAGTD